AEDRIVLLEKVLGLPNAQIEDLFEADYYAAAASATLGKSISLVPEDRAAGGVLEQIKTASKRLEIDLPKDWKVPVAARIARQLATAGGTVPSKATVERAAKLFAEINLRFV